MARPNLAPRRSALGELLLKLVLLQGTGVWTRVITRAAHMTRRAVTQIWDPAVRVHLGERTLLMPLSHELPIYLASLPLYNKNVGLLARAIEADASIQSGDFLIDVGANIGDTAAVVANHSTMPVLCIEPHPVFNSYLRANRHDLDCVVGVERAFIRFNDEDPVGRWAVSSGTARLLLGEGEQAPPSLTLSEVLDRHPGLGRPRVVKLDTDGFDVEIVSSESGFMAKWHPIIFFEYAPSFSQVRSTDLAGLCDQLVALGYQTMLVFDNFGGFLGQVELADRVRVSEVDSYSKSMAAWNGFVDVCLFHGNDMRLAHSFRTLVMECQMDLV